ncbi:hypothetical protein FNL56_21480 [Tardiphaga sp. vice304]|uniref:hypothetical protein n=1 Tax=Tardiphaga sp. vice304 TaxID=2592817 RepID=UPI0011641A32|nr:hypothetical protein [Tardiphaga sp. vice304]QDM28395.1 hypothetical protein FNL56_21480 [Tardiphaga sp. vice304]
MTTKTATRCPTYRSMCIMPDGSRETIGAAEAKGFTIASAQTTSRSVSKPAPAVASYTPRPMTFSQLVAALPEAQGRPAAAAALADNFTADTLSLTSAAATLRGLPTEQDDTTMTTSTSKLSAADVASFNRRAELRVTALTRNGQKGNEAAAVEARKIKLGLSIVSQTGVSYGSAFASVGLDARATISAILGVAN